MRDEDKEEGESARAAKNEEDSMEWVRWGSFVDSS